VEELNDCQLHLIAPITQRTTMSPNRKRKRVYASTSTSAREQELQRRIRELEQEAEIRAALEQQNFEKVEIRAALEAGTYFSRVRDVWGVRQVDVRRGGLTAFNSLRRASCPTLAEYTVTRASATGQGGFAADAAEISRTSSVTQRTLFHTDFLGADRHTAELAHLIPASAQYAAMLSDVACHNARSTWRQYLSRC
jgi:hypothetical protein